MLTAFQTIRLVAAQRQAERKHLLQLGLDACGDGRGRHIDTGRFRGGEAGRIAARDIFLVQRNRVVAPLDGGGLQQPRSRHLFDHLGARVLAAEAGPLVSPVLSLGVRFHGRCSCQQGQQLHQYAEGTSGSDGDILHYSPANSKSLAHLVLPWSAAFIRGVKPKLFFGSIVRLRHRVISMFTTSERPVRVDEQDD